MVVIFKGSSSHDTITSLYNLEFVLNTQLESEAVESI